MTPKVQWTLPTPLWNTSTPEDATRLHSRFHEPFILRFASDNFMEEFFQLVAHAPHRIGEWEVEHETWRDPTTPPLAIEKMPRLAQRLFRLRASLADQAVGMVPSGTILPFEEASPPDKPLKLFQPGHQRFYLVTAGLVCRKPGLPEKHLDTGGVERVSFVVRRLWPKVEGTIPETWDTSTCDQYAYVAVSGGKSEWQKVTNPDDMMPEEERNPLFRVAYNKAGRTRHLWSGLVPVGKRETYLGSVKVPAGPPDDDDPAEDLRLNLLNMQVMAPWEAIVDYKENREALKSSEEVPDFFKEDYPPSPPDDDDEPTDYIKYDPTTDDQVYMQTWYVLLDMADYLEKYLNDVWSFVESETAAANTGWDNSDPKRILLNTLQIIPVPGDNSLAAALKKVTNEDNRQKLEEATTVYNSQAVDVSEKWPNFIFDLTAIEDMSSAVRNQIEAAFEMTKKPDRMPPRPFAAEQAERPINEPAWFIIRFVYERPFCTPIFLPVLSDSSRPFQMASFFDPDAPARPIRIALPLDTSPEGLRKFDRNTAFMMSDALCGQMSKMREFGLGDLVRAVLPWPLHKDLNLDKLGLCSEKGDGFGMVCSLSIPIVTICALILLIMIVTLLDTIFRWMPYFIACFPIRKK